MGINWGEKGISFPLFPGREEMKFRKANKINFFYIAKNLDHFLHTWADEDAKRKVITFPEEDQDAYQMHPLSLPEKH